MCLTCFFSLSLPPSLSLFLSRYRSLSVSLSVSVSVSLSLFLCLSGCLCLSLFSFCLSFFPACLSPSPFSLSFCLTHSACLPLSMTFFPSLSLCFTHASDTYNIRCTDIQVEKKERSAMPARFVTTSSVTKRAGIAAHFVTLVTKRAATGTLLQLWIVNRS